MNRIPIDKNCKSVTIGTSVELVSFFEDDSNIREIIEFARKGRLKDNLYAVTEYTNKAVITPLDYRGRL